MAERWNREDIQKYSKHNKPLFSRKDDVRYRASLKCVCKHKFFPWHNEEGKCHANKTNGQQCTCIEFIPGI